jgi:hypothetical protein
MKAMTAEQKQIINDLLVKVGDLLSEDKMTHILNAIKPEASSNYPHGQTIIKDLNILLTKKNPNKENNTMKAMTAEQISEIINLMEKAGDIYDASQRTAIDRAIADHTSGKKIASSEKAEATINMIKNAIANKIAIQKDEAKKAKAAEKTINKSKEDNMKAIQPKEEIIIIEDGFDNKKEATMAPNTCPKCSGTGLYNVPLKDGSIGKCFACKGTGTKQPQNRAMTEAQIKFIRDLFAEAKQFMTQEQIDNLVNAMLAHKSGAHTKSIQWASAAIDKLKEIKATKKS